MSTGRVILILALFFSVIAGTITAAILVSNDSDQKQEFAGAYIDDIPPFEPKLGFEAMWWDEFDDENIDRTKWYVQPDVIDYYANNRQIQHYIDSPSALDAINGTLTIIANNPGEIQYDGNNYDQIYYTSARINTNVTGGRWFPGMEANGSTWSVIRIEARIKAPRGPGVVGAFWLLPVDNSCNGEIDVFETPHCDRVSVGSWYTNSSSDRGITKSGTTIKTNDDVCDYFMTYAIEWSDEYIKYFVDDDMIFVMDNSTWFGKCDSSDPGAPYDRPFYIILNTVIGSVWSGIPENSIFPSMMEVDYVRVFGIRDVY